MPTTNLTYCRDNLRGYQEAITKMVQGDVVRNESEAWGKRSWPPTGAGSGELSDCLVLAPQTAAGYGEARP